MTAARFAIDGVGGNLTVYDDRVELTPKGIVGFLTKGLKGTKSVPIASITAIQFKDAGLLVNGYLQLTIPGGVESRGGVFDATVDENSFFFNTSTAPEVKKAKTFIESQMTAARNAARAPQVGGLAEQIAKLAQLRDQGVLDATEFAAAKAKLLADA